MTEKDIEILMKGIGPVIRDLLTRHMDVTEKVVNGLSDRIVQLTNENLGLRARLATLEAQQGYEVVGHDKDHKPRIRATGRRAA